MPASLALTAIYDGSELLGRRCFDHLVTELSAALGLTAPRYRLWLFLRERGWNPDCLTRLESLHFCDWQLKNFLNQEGLRMSSRRARALRRRMASYSPASQAVDPNEGWEGDF